MSLDPHPLTPREHALLMSTQEVGVEVGSLQRDAWGKITGLPMSPSPKASLPSIPGFPDSSVGKESAWNAGDPGLIPGLGRSPGEGKGYPLQYSGLENSMDCVVPGVVRSQTRLKSWLSLSRQ